MWYLCHAHMGVDPARPTPACIVVAVPPPSPSPLQAADTAIYEVEVKTGRMKV